MQETLPRPKKTPAPEGYAHQTRYTERGNASEKITWDKTSKALKSKYSIVMCTLRLFCGMFGTIEGHAFLHSPQFIYSMFITVSSVFLKRDYLTGQLSSLGW
jgi:hypothetical protein